MNSADLITRSARNARNRHAEAPDVGPADIFRDYERYLRRAQAYFDLGKLEEAAVFAAVAAHVALRPHPGFFASPRLERLLVEIGRRTATSHPYLRILDPTRRPRTILHVATELRGVGGLSNMLGHWVGADSTRMHSVALTQHHGSVLGPVPAAVERSGGRIMRLNRGLGGMLDWAARLRLLSRQYDAVVLHSYSQDPIPTLAFAEAKRRPPVLLLNHGDHLFWLGVAIADVVINLRDAAQDLSIHRRGTEPRRNVIVPTVVAATTRTRTREQAKAELGLDAGATLLFSAARGMKYRSQNGRSFADTHVDVLQRHPNAQLWVLGAGDPEDWRAASAAVQGRIKPLPESMNTRVYFEAADIYVDSFPFVSSTSMMEAAGLGTPLVSRFYGEDDARIFAINHPGIDKPTLHGANEPEYIAHLDALLADPDLRARKGEEARLAVLHYHTPPSWMNFVENAYALAMELPPIDPNAQLARMADECFATCEPDRSLYDIFGFEHARPSTLMRQYLGALPLPARLEVWRELCDAGGFETPRQMVRGLLPDGIVRLLKDRG